MMQKKIMEHTFRFLFTTTSLLALSPVIHAEEALLTSEKPDSDWLVLVSPFVWAPSMKGDASLGGVNTEVDVPFSEVVGNLESVFMGNVELSNRTVGFYIDGVYANTHQSERVFGQKVGLSITQSTVAAGVYYRAYEQALGGTTVFGEPRSWRVEPTVGARWTKLSTKLDVNSIGFSTKKTTNWTDPFVGVRMHADLNERWTLSGEADVGGFDTSSKKTFNAQGYLGFRVYLFERPAILRAGYRVLSQDYRTSDFTGNKFKYDVTQRGPVLGLSLRF